VTALRSRPQLLSSLALHCMIVRVGYVSCSMRMIVVNGIVGASSSTILVPNSTNGALPDVTHHPTRLTRMVRGAGKSSCAYSLYTSVCLSLRCRWTVCVYVCVRVSVLFDAVHVIYNVVLSINQSIVPATFRSLQSEESLQVFSFLTKADHMAANSVITRCIHECCSLLFNRAFGTWS